MTDADASPPHAPDLLGAFGKLREALAALRNLEHLLASVQVGPKLLSHVLPELVASAASWRSEGLVLVEHCGERLDAAERLAPFRVHFEQTLEDISSSLGRVAATSLSAKTRLTMEREMRRLLPALGTSLEHLEILVDSTSVRGVPLSLAELLLSKPELGSDRPYRPVRVRGPASELEVVLPARLMLRSLGTLLSQAGPEVGLDVSVVDARCRLTLGPAPRDGMLAQLPILNHLPESTGVLQSALGHWGIVVADDGLSLELPYRGAH